jgi:hypothetical protein
VEKRHAWHGLFMPGSSQNPIAKLEFFTACIKNGEEGVLRIAKVQFNFTVTIAIPKVPVIGDLSCCASNHFL